MTWGTKGQGGPVYDKDSCGEDHLGRRERGLTTNRTCLSCDLPRQRRSIFLYLICRRRRSGRQHGTRTLETYRSLGPETRRRTGGGVQGRTVGCFRPRVTIDDLPELLGSIHCPNDDD